MRDVAKFVSSIAPHRKCHWCTTATMLANPYAATPAASPRFSDLRLGESKSIDDDDDDARSLFLSEQTRARPLLSSGGLTAPYQSYAYSRLRHPATLHPPATFCHTLYSSRIYTHVHWHAAAVRTYVHVYTRTLIRIYMLLHINIYIYTCIYIYIYVYM